MRKTIVRTCLIAAFICCLLTVTAFAESATVTGSEVNMRSGPGLNYAVVDCLPRGTSVTVLNRSNSDWYSISYNGSEGFMSSNYLSLTEESGNADIVYSDGTGYINAMYVRFRSGPSTDSSILGEYSTGKEVSITGTSGEWTACVINGQSGYVFSKYISSYSESDSGYNEGYEADPQESDGTVIITPPEETQSPAKPDSSENENGDIIVIIPGSGSEPEPTPAPSPSQEPEVIIPPAPSEEPEAVIPPAPSEKPQPSERPQPSEKPEDSDDTIIVLPEGGSSQTEPEESPEPEAPEISVDKTEPRPGYITGDYVRFRTGPSTSYSIIDSYNRGTEITITGTSGDWTACTIDGKDGFVYSGYVKEKESKPAENQGTDDSTVVTPESSEPGYITGNNVRFRSGPSTSYDILDELFYGNAVTITGTSGDWTAIIHDGQSGYVFSQYVKKGEYSHQSSGGTELGREIADYALQYVGYNYTWGGTSPETGFDCSGFTSYVYAHFGYTLNRVACDQARNGVHVDPSDMQPGDIICFYSGGDYIGHVGLYIGSNMFVHAANSRTGVVTTELSGYYESRGYEVRRII